MLHAIVFVYERKRRKQETFDREERVKEKRKQLNWRNDK
jgi:hypothetical protein